MKDIMLPPYTDLLDNERKDVLKRLGVFSDSFVLAGGTAIMLQIGHRKSFDFDCFSQKPLSERLLYRIRQTFGKDMVTVVDETWMQTIRTKTGIDVSFVHYPYSPLKNPIQTKYIPIFSVDDLAANKAHVIGRRPAWRDYVDLFFLLKKNLYSMESLINLSQKKFPGEFNPKLFLEQLVYFDDLEIIPTEFIKESYAPGQIQSFLQKKTADYLQKILRTGR